MASLVRDFRAGRLKLFTPPGKPGRSSAPATDRARGRVVELRRQGLSVHEISSKLADEGTPLNRTSVGQILTEEGFGRLLRGPARFASVNPATAGRDTRLPRVATIDFTDTPDTATTSMAGLLLLLPDLLLTLDLPGLVTAAGYPGTRTVPAISWICSLLALKLTNTRRVSHVDDLLCDPGAALFAGLQTLPKNSALSDYSHRLTHTHQRQLLTAPALAKHYVPTHSQRARSVLTFFAQDSGTHNLVYANADLSKTTQARQAIAFCDHWKNVSGADPHMLVMDQKVTTHTILGELDARGVKFLTLRMRSPALMAYINGLTPADYKTITLDRSGNHTKPRVHDTTGVKLTGYPGTVRQLIVTGLGHDTPTVIITNDHTTPTKTLLAHYARRMTIEQRLAEIIRAFHLDALSSTVNLNVDLNVDLDVVLCVLAQAVTAAFRTRLAGAYTTVTPDVLQRRFLQTAGEI